MPKDYNKKRMVKHVNEGIFLGNTQIFNLWKVAEKI